MVNPLGTISMQDMRYLNIFYKITKIHSDYNFLYNNTLFFCVPKRFLFKAIGKNNSNLKKINSLIGKRIKVVPTPKDISYVKEFIKIIVSPIEINNIEINDSEIIINAGKDKSMLFGRDKKKFFELQKILKSFFSKELKIV